MVPSPASTSITAGVGTYDVELKNRPTYGISVHLHVAARHSDQRTTKRLRMRMILPSRRGLLLKLFKLPQPVAPSL